MVSNRRTEIYDESGTPKNSQPAEKLGRLVSWFQGFDGCVVAFSGGVDSSLLSLAAKSALDQKAIAVFSVSPAIARKEIEEAENVAREIGIKLVVVSQDDLGTEGYVENQVTRCYYCRKNLADALDPIAKKFGITLRVDGNHIDDTKSPRPGVKALRESGFRAPYVELGFSKADIREIARYVNLSNADRPSEACLSSRIAFGQKIELATLDMIEKAEREVMEITKAQIVRVRTIGRNAIVEVDASSLKAAFDASTRIEECLKQFGYERVEISKEGYVSGRMLDLFVRNETH